MRSAILKFDVHSAFAISHPIYEMQENSITQISVNVYMHKIFQIFLTFNKTRKEWSFHG